VRWKRERIERLANAIATHVSLDVLREVVAQFGIVKNFDELLKTGSQDPVVRAQELALLVVEAHEEIELADHFARSLYFKLWEDPAAGKALNEFATDDDAAHQAAHVKRAATLSDRALARFLEETRPRICMICAGVMIAGKMHVSKGTGFLVGPDLVITARHVLKYHIKNGKAIDPKPGPIGAFFDHFEGDPIDDFDVARNPPFFIEFEDDWLVTSCDVMSSDGKIREPTDEQVVELCTNLDMALVKLKQEVGHYTRSLKGGTRRLWFEIPDDAVAATLQHDDRVIIRQHPEGHPLRIDFGRFRHVDRSSTRIRYTTETDPGSSGAPCFNQHFQLIGMHNAEYRPDGEISVLNQAIRFDHIAKKIRKRLEDRAARDQLAGVVRPTSVRIWNASTSLESPKPILGRTTFLEWIERASQAMPPSRADRQYVAIANRKGSGRTFSADILRAARPSSTDRIVVLGTPTEALPLSITDFLSAIVDQLRIPPSEVAMIQARPSEDLPDGNWDGDKLSRWASEAVPKDFSEILGKHRKFKVDLVEEANQIVKLLTDSGRSPSPEDLALAASKEERIETRYRWERIWIVIDGLNEGGEDDSVPLSEEVRNLIAGLAGANFDETSISEELRRLRWIFLGRTPYRISPHQICEEVLNSDRIGLEELLECMAALAATFDRPLSEDFRSPIRMHFKLAIRDQTVRRKLATPAERLTALQEDLAKFAPVFAEEIRGLP
jgi:hypothetical protein